MSNDKPKPGRPTKYKAGYAKQAYFASRQFGATIPELAQLFDVVESTVNLWITKYPKFSDAVKNGRNEYDNSNVQEALLKRALGYKTKEDTVHYKIFKDKDGHTYQEPECRITREVEVPPNVRACHIWLHNRAGWKNISERPELPPAQPMQINVILEPPKRITVDAQVKELNGS